MIAVGIDVGLTGAAAFLGSNGTCTVEDLPTVDLAGNGLIRRRIDGRAFAEIMRRNCPVGEPVRVFMEQVSTMGGKNNAVQTQGSLMRSLGAIEATLEVLRVPALMVHPKAWKGFYGLSSDKKESLQVARTLYPRAPLTLARHHNRAESLLIAHWGMQKELA
jgi:hypothetical protein